MGFIDNIKQVFSGSPQGQIDRSSKGTVRNSWYGNAFQRQSNYGQPNPQDLNVILKLYQKDPVVQAAVKTRVNAILASGYTVEGAVNTVKNANSVLDTTGFSYSFLWQVVVNALLYNHVFIEIERKNSGAPANLHVLETPYMEIQHDEHGEIEGFIQRGESGEAIFFPPEDIVFIKTNNVSSAVWGEVELRSLFRTLNTKNQIEKFLEHLADTNAWRQVMKTKMSDANIEEFLPYYYAQAQSPNEMLVLQTKGSSSDDVDKDTKFEVLRDPKDLKEFQDTLEYFRTQALMGLNVPPIMIGLPDSSNRSNSDMQFKSFNIANESVRKILKGFFDELFKKMSLGNVEYSWNPIDERSEKDDIEIAERLVNMGAKPKQVEKFLRSTGLELPDGEIFKDEPEGKSMDMFASRQGKSDGEGNERIGTGEEGTTREEQLK